MDLGLEGRVALVTGGSQGIGREIALTLATEGADVAICARREQVVDATTADLRALGRDALGVVADVATTSGVQRVSDAVHEHFGRVDILINNAGKSSMKALLDLTDEDWYASIDLNLMSAVRMSQAFVPGMRERGWGRIVNISSRQGREPDEFFGPYAASKAALINFSKTQSNAFSRDGVLTNCVVPGLIKGEGVQAAAEKSAEVTGKTVEEVYEATLRKRPIPIGRMGEPSDVSGLVALLVSERGSWITGSCFTVDGGIVRSDR
ncbi:MAG: SDR family NAD(P)-dependent oxidoreductase [Actinobacteria bacterium]|nr:SDR family NAD(P)-dependent oxidoreductase [Actinomycetota bacterium]